MPGTGLPNFLIKWVTAFLTNRQQRVKIGNTTSDWKHIKAGVPQGTLLGPVGFLLHIDDLQTIVNTCKYVDDSTLWESCTATGNDSQIQMACDQAVEWSDKNKMQLNKDKTKEMLISFSKAASNVPAVTIDGQPIDRVSSAKLLGITLSDTLSWEEHINNICSKGSQRLYFLCLLRRAGVVPNDILHVYKASVRPILEYASEVWAKHLTEAQSNSIEAIQRRGLAIIYPDQSYRNALKIAKIETLANRRDNACRKFFAKIQNPEHKLHYLLPKPRNLERNLRSHARYPLPKVRTERCKRTLINYGLYNYQ